MRERTKWQENGRLKTTLLSWTQTNGRWLAVCLLLLFFGRLLHTESRKSITFDEPPHVLNSLQYFQTRPMVSTINNPPLIHAWMGTLMQLVGLEYDMGYEQDVWNWGDGFDIASVFFWQVNENWPQFFWVSRLAIIFLALLLAALVYRWAAQLYDRATPACLALLLLTFDPNILGFSHLATTDLGIAAFFTLAGYGLWLYWQRPSWGRLAWAGIVVGLTLGAKFSGVILVPAILLFTVYRWFVGERTLVSAARAAGATLVILLIAALVLLAVYRFQLSLLVADYQFQQAHFAEGHEAYLLGEVSRSGWWYYYPIVFLAKTPTGLLVLLLLAVGLFLASKSYRWDYLWLLLLAGAVFGAALTGSINIGYRYLLPILPPLFVFLGQLALPTTAVKWAWPTTGALLAFVLASILIHPHYLSFFNVLAGGPENGWRIVVDSNIDWGQDMEELGRYLAERGVEDAHISWFSTVSPQRYGIPGTSFLTWSPSYRDVIYDDLYLERPLPGLYAISATQLAGPYLHDDFEGMAWFRQRQPQDKVGYTYFIYEVQPDGPPVGLALSGVGIAMLTPESINMLTRGNNIGLRHFDARSSFLWAGGGAAEGVWTAVGAGHQPTHPWLQQFYALADGVTTDERTVEGTAWQYHLYQWSQSPLPAKERVPETAVFGDTVQLLGYDMGELVEAGRPLELLTFWRIKQPATNELKLFVHLFDEAGNLIAQHDGLDVITSGLQAEDEFAQLHTLFLPDPLPAGTYTLQVGVYDSATLARLALPPDSEFSDHVVLLSFSVEN